MRQTAHLVLALLVVAASLAAVPAAGASAFDGAARDHPVGVATFDQPRDARNASLEVTAFEVSDDEIGPDESLAFAARLHGNATDSLKERLALAVDGERRPIGTLAVRDGHAEFIPADDGWSCEVEVDVGEDGITITIRCGWDAAGTELSPGTHWIGLEDHDPVEVEVEGGADGGSDDSGPGNGTETSPGNESPGLAVESYEVADRTPGESLVVGVTYDLSCDGSAQAPLYLRVDGEPAPVGNVHVDGNHTRATVETVAPGATEVGIEVECHLVDDDGDGRYDGVACELVVDADTLPSGTHEVGVNELDPVPVTVDPGNRSTGGDDPGNRSTGTRESNASTGAGDGTDAGNATTGNESTTGTANGSTTTGTGNESTTGNANGSTTTGTANGSTTTGTGNESDTGTANGSTKDDGSAATGGSDDEGGSSDDGSSGPGSGEEATTDPDGTTGPDGAVDPSRPESGTGSTPGGSESGGESNDGTAVGDFLTTMLWWLAGVLAAIAGIVAASSGAVIGLLVVALFALAIVGLSLLASRWEAAKRWFWKTLYGIGNSCKLIWKRLKKIGEEIAEFASEAADETGDYLERSAEGATAVGEGFERNLEQFFEEFPEDPGGALKRQGKKMVDGAKKSGKLIKEKAKDAYEGTKEALKDAGQAIENEASDAWEGTKEVLGEAGEMLGW